MMRRQIRAQRNPDRWHRLQPVLSPKMPSQKNEIRETNLTDPLYGGLSLTGPLDPGDSRIGQPIQDKVRIRYAFRCASGQETSARALAGPAAPAPPRSRNPNRPIIDE